VSAGEVGSKLHVRTVLSGSVQRSGGRMRLAAQLASAKDGLVIWSERYERDVGDVFALQDDITRSIVGALRVALGTSGPTGTGKALASHGTTNLEAYDLYLRGLYFYQQRGPGLLRAVDYFQQAIAKDSAFARAHAALAFALSSMAYYPTSGIAVSEAAQRADSSARRALALDSTLSDAHVAMALAQQLAGHWNVAASAYERALVVDPNSKIAHHQYGRFLMTFSTQYGKAVDELSRARDLDPLDASVAGMLAWAWMLRGDNDRAMAVGQRAFDIDSNIGGPARNPLLLATFESGRIAQARALAERIARSGHLGSTTTGWVSYVFGRTGDRARAVEITRQLEALPDPLKRDLGYAYLGLGDTARALSRFEQDAKQGFVITAPWGLPMFDELRASPRFAALMRSYGLDERVLTSPRGGRP
jgi:serine/threonine-protein kinase